MSAEVQGAQQERQQQKKESQPGRRKSFSSSKSRSWQPDSKYIKSLDELPKPLPTTYSEFLEYGNKYPAVGAAALSGFTILRDLNSMRSS